MLILPFYYFSLFFLHLSPPQNECGCIPTKVLGEEISYRYHAKYEKNFAAFPKCKTTIDVKTVRSWEKKYQSLMSTVQANSERIKASPEDTLYTVQGYIYKVENNGNDCDLHFEIGTARGSDQRIIVEISKDNCVLQEKIVKELQKKGFLMGQRAYKGMKCTFSGLGFYDGKHPLKSDKKHTQGNTWEIHPVQSMVLE